MGKTIEATDVPVLSKVCSQIFASTLSEMCLPMIVGTWEILIILIPLPGSHIPM